MMLRSVVSGEATHFDRCPNLTRLETSLRQVLKSDHEQVAFWGVLSGFQLSLVDFFRGNWESALSLARASCRPELGSAMEGLGIVTLFRQMAYAGDWAGAITIFNSKRARLTLSGRQNTSGPWWMLANAIEGLVILGEQTQAAQLYPLARRL
jgi:hypothetical protein